MRELYSDNLEEIKGKMDELWQEDQKFKSMITRVWQRNIAFSNGNQQAAYGDAAPLMVNNQPVNTTQHDSRYNMYITNEIEPINRTLVSYMTGKKPAAEAVSADKSERGRGIAKVADRIHDAKYDLDFESYNTEMSAFWALNCGSVFRKDWWDVTIGRDVQLPKFDELGNEIYDEAGNQVMQSRKVGGNSVAILTGFSISTDYSCTNFRQIPWIRESYAMPVEWAREAFDIEGEGFTGKAKLIKDDGGLGAGLSAFEEIKFSVPYSSPYGSSEKSSKDKCVVHELFVRPTRDFPEGRMIILAGSQVVYVGKSPSYIPIEPLMWHPYNHFGYEPYVGRFFYKSLIEQLIPIQLRINEINGAILENANTMAKPNIMAAIGQLKRGIMNGSGANIYTYQAIPGASPPFALEGVPLPSQFFKEKQDLIDAMVRIAGTNFVMQGQPPTGVSAASAIQQLLENANSQHSNMMISWARYHEEGFTKKLRIIHKHGDFPDEDLVNYIRTISKDTTEQDIESFTGQKDLSDGISVKIESSSMIPKSEVTKRDTYTTLAKDDLLGPALREDSPRGEEARRNLLKLLGVDALETEEATDIKKAKWENERIKRSQPAAFYPKDNHPIHLSCHYAQVKNPEFLEHASDEIKLALDQHIQEHEMAVEEEKAKAMMEQAAQQEQAPEMSSPDESFGGGVGSMPPPQGAMQEAPQVLQ